MHSSSEHAYDVIILTDDRYEAPKNLNPYIEQILLEEQLLMDAFAQLGLRSKRVSWSHPDFRWESTRSALFHTTWDYSSRYQEFLLWLKSVEKKVQLFNSPKLIHWNVDKHYLQDLVRRGVKVPPTYFFEIGEKKSFKDTFQKSGWAEAILKPAVSGSARHTYRASESNREEIEGIFQELIQRESMLIQPFLESVVTEGEISLIVIDGKVTHAVRKTAKPGDFRVQDDHGGSVRAHIPTQEEVTFAEEAVAACEEAPLYARVDFVRDNNNQLALMELELIEPELFFRFCPSAAAALARAIKRKVF